VLEVKDDLLKEFKDRMHFTHSSEDNSLKRLLSLSYSALTSMVGTFDIDVNARARELVLERTRYVYNEALEFFNTNFSSEISSVQLEIALEEISLEEDTDATI
jgi:hypothetical protein